MDKLTFLALSIAIGIASVSLSVNFGCGLKAMSRNSETAGRVYILTMIGGAFIEFTVLILLALSLMKKT